jgi:hypothetical protein
MRLKAKLPKGGRLRWLLGCVNHGVTSVGIEEPKQFNEPGLFLIRPDGTLYMAAVQSMPFARPQFEEVLKALDFIKARDYPPRGDA